MLLGLLNVLRSHGAVQLTWRSTTLPWPRGLLVRHRGTLASRGIHLTDNLGPGDLFACQDVGAKIMPAQLRIRLLERGLGWCSFTQQIFALEDMHSSYRSYEGQQRKELFYNALSRAKRKTLPFDSEMMWKLVRGALPLSFNTTPYHMRSAETYCSRKSSLTIDRILPSRGYVCGNVRFLPFWLNASLHVFQDSKALRIAERFAGQRPKLLVPSIGLSEQAQARAKLNRTRSRALSRGIVVDTSFDFDALLQAGLFTSHCPYSGIRLSYHKKLEPKAKFDSPSFDRIDPKGSYSWGNVQMVAMAVNSLKSDIPIRSMANLVDAIQYLQSSEFYDSHVPLCAR